MSTEHTFSDQRLGIRSCNILPYQGSDGDAIGAGATVTIGSWQVVIGRDSQGAGYRGWYEHTTQGEDGGAGVLLFDGNELSDYDGLFELPRNVIHAIRILGFEVAPEFEPGNA